MAMQFRPPRSIWEWGLLFSPAVVIWTASAIWLAFPHQGDVGVLLGGPFYGSVAALFVSALAGNVFTIPNPQRSVRYSAVVLCALLVFILNLGTAFAGCAVVLMR